MVMTSNFEYLVNKVVLITGTSGTVGAEILDFISKIDKPPSKIIALDNNESGQFELEQRYTGKPILKAIVADIRSINDLEYYFKGVDVIFHCAALKHVTVCERSPEQAVESNVIGVQNVIRAAQRASVEKCIFTSSDKAVNPTNVMGTSKLMGERLITATNDKTFDTKFCSTRFGNVLGSSGSVLPIFKRQITDNKKITLTSLEMTRFVMSLQEAASLVVNSGSLMKGGEIYITKMPVIKILNLALAMLKYFKGLEVPDAMQWVEIIGTKPGEKLYEELMTEEERPRACEVADYYIVLPYNKIFIDKNSPSDELTSRVEKVYNSHNQEPLDVHETLNLLVSYNLLENIELSNKCLCNWSDTS